MLTRSSSLFLNAWTSSNSIAMDAHRGHPFLVKDRQSMLELILANRILFHCTAHRTDIDLHQHSIRCTSSGDMTGCPSTDDR
ncbi:hypothetical protein EDD18DRAFT_1358318 [Armillaria luteobubalina]|uniref:Uncharacterized protein n=1 Tax=Armillaria luteobubalina TaxID=153913 RepID=A0AA39PWK3_9AGAR|nr:hypothetical protein EDD18DRAFT_1358318 [Armillaria luteobubalina]